MADAVADLSLASLAARLLGPVAMVAEDAVRRLGLAIDGPAAADGPAAEDDGSTGVAQADGASSGLASSASGLASAGNQLASAGGAAGRLGGISATLSPMQAAIAAEHSAVQPVGRPTPPGLGSGAVLRTNSAPGAAARAEAGSPDAVDLPVATGRAPNPTPAVPVLAAAPATDAAASAIPKSAATPDARSLGNASGAVEAGPLAARQRAAVSSAATPVADAGRPAPVASDSGGRLVPHRIDAAAGTAAANPSDYRKPLPLGATSGSAVAWALRGRVVGTARAPAAPDQSRQVAQPNPPRWPASGADSPPAVGPRPAGPNRETGPAAAVASAVAVAVAVAVETGIPAAMSSPDEKPPPVTHSSALSSLPLPPPLPLPPQPANATSGLLRLRWPDDVPPTFAVDWPAAAASGGALPAPPSHPMRVLPPAALDRQTATPPRQWRRIGNRLDRALAPVFGQAARVSGLVDTAEQPAAMPQTYPAEMAAESGSAQAGRYVRPSVPLSEPSVNDPAADSGFDAPATQVSNTFNVKVALDGGGGAAERRRIEESIGEWLHQAARRQGLLP